MSIDTIFLSTESPRGDSKKKLKMDAIYGQQWIQELSKIQEIACAGNLALLFTSVVAIVLLFYLNDDLFYMVFILLQ